MDEAKKEMQTPFEPFLVTEYSADVYQAAAWAAGKSITPDKELIQRHLKDLKEYDKGKTLYQPSFYASYSVIYTRDSLSGPVREVKGYSCRPLPGLNAEVF
ncbi:hypothetical protein [Cupriavidus taiwanensis]|uniref:hypothetical protein n=1 Tax=Cupriavidus taiwanensis TaxID=164546 RepID=UPI000E2E909E|nr:hypothetical protein [Cupriavidus taiwanensis]